jgi:hypothetical protein
MFRTSTKLFKTILEAIDLLKENFPNLPFAYLDELMSRYNENPANDWINWIITSNNNLFQQYQNEDTLQWLRPFHETLAQLLLDYDIEVKKQSQHPLITSSIFMRDCHLIKHYGFHSFPLIRKHIKCIENMPMYKSRYYNNDQVFNESFSMQGGIQEEDTPRSPVLAPHLGYLKDAFFQSIVGYYSGSNMSHIKFSGISIEKGGIFNVLHIILDQGAHIRFLGGLAPSLNTESAYSHGPIFMVASNIQQMGNMEVFNIPIADLLFIIPDREMHGRLTQLLNRAAVIGLITAEEINYLLMNQILTYQDYYERHCAMSIVVNSESEPTESEDTRAMSELIEGSPFSSRAPSFCKQALFQIAVRTEDGVSKELAKKADLSL